jgi:hypothetical protein
LYKMAVAHEEIDVVSMASLVALALPPKAAPVPRIALLVAETLSAPVKFSEAVVAPPAPPASPEAPAIPIRLFVCVVLAVTSSR